jgi:hypothetical protein
MLKKRNQDFASLRQHIVIFGWLNSRVQQFECFLSSNSDLDALVEEVEIWESKMSGD